MLNTTVERLQCAKKSCTGKLELISQTKNHSPIAKDIFEVRSGHLNCLKCHATFPIIAGIAVLVNHVQDYLTAHVKGISKIIQTADLPKEYRHEFLAAKKELQTEHIEEDLESERVNALYVMNHYLRTNQKSSSTQANRPWWQPLSGDSSPLLDTLIHQYWDHGPFEVIYQWIHQLQSEHRRGDLIELGCGVGGLYRILQTDLQSYLGVDSSFASIALARHLALGMPYPHPIRIPNDLLQGQVSKTISLPQAADLTGTADFIVADLDQPPLQKEQWDITVALNAIDMLDHPEQLPQLQWKLLKKGGIAIQSCPYIWHEKVAKKLRSKLPKNIQTSSKAIEWLYASHGLAIEKSIEHLPWLFFKHVRQLEIYSVHIFSSKKE